MRSKISPFTFLGLCISLFGFVVLRFAFRAFGPSASVITGVWKELAVWSLAAVLLLLVRFGERLPLNSIRIGVTPWRQSLRYGCILTGLCGVTAWIVLSFTGYGHGPGSAEFNKIPISFETLVVIRSGIVEELFFRGYAPTSRPNTKRTGKPTLRTRNITSGNRFEKSCFLSLPNPAVS